MYLYFSSIKCTSFSLTDSNNNEINPVLLFTSHRLTVVCLFVFLKYFIARLFLFLIRRCYFFFLLLLLLLLLQRLPLPCASPLTSWRFLSIFFLISFVYYLFFFLILSFFLLVQTDTSCCYLSFVAVVHGVVSIDAMVLCQLELVKFSRSYIDILQKMSLSNSTTPAILYARALLSRIIIIFKADCERRPSQSLSLVKLFYFYNFFFSFVFI